MRLFGKGNAGHDTRLTPVTKNPLLLKYLQSDGMREKLGCEPSGLGYLILPGREFVTQVYSLRDMQRPDQELLRVNEIKPGEYRKSE